MNKWLWYSLVVIAVILLFFSVMTGNVLIAILALGLTLYLKRYYHQIPLPKSFEKHKIYSNLSGKIYTPQKK